MTDIQVRRVGVLVLCAVVAAIVAVYLWDSRGSSPYVAKGEEIQQRLQFRDNCRSDSSVNRGECEVNDAILRQSGQ